MNIAGLSRAAVLAALYNRARPQGMGFMHYDPKPINEAQAEVLLAGIKRPSFDYLQGRVMKVDLSTDEVRTDLYNRDNGPNAAEEVIEALRRTGKVHSAEIQREHGKSTLVAAAEADREMDAPPRPTEVKGGVAVMHLGLGDMRGHLKPKIDEVLKDRN